MGLICTTPPAAEPVTLAQAKNHLRITSNEQAVNDLLNALIASARDHVEQVTGLQLITAIFKQTLDAFPREGVIELEASPAQSTDLSVKYTDLDGVQRTLASANYSVDLSVEPARIVLKEAPPATADVVGAVEIAFKAGFGASGSSVPASLLEAIIVKIGQLHDDPSGPDPPSVAALCAPHRIYR